MRVKILTVLVILLSIARIALSKSYYYEPGFGYVKDPEDVFEYDYSDYKFEEEIKKEIPCSPPREVANGETIVWGEGLLLEYRCKPDFFPVGITHGACDLSTGKWTIEPPVCAESGCPELTAPTHGVVNLDVSGGIASFVCRQGYFLLGDETLVCEQGQWKGTFPLCAVTAQPNKRTKSRQKTPSKSSGQGKDFSLELSDESCFYNAVTPPVIANAVVNTEYQMNRVLQRYVMVATYTCMGGFRLRDPENAQLFCRSMVWGADVWPDCIAEDDLCEMDNGGCDHFCTPQGKNRYACSCNEGYNLARDAKTCKDANECAIDNGGCEQECFNTLGSFFCSCLDGFVPKGSKCIDVNECEKSMNQCPGPCINLAGSYRCDCNITGFTHSEAPDICNDIDECAEDNGGCDDVCINKRGTFECRCNAKGRKLGEDGHSCVDVDECSRYKSKVCAHGRCVNNEGSYTCICSSGYAHAENNSKCIDIDECLNNNGGCSHSCENQDGSYKCLCNVGFAVSHADNSQCEDVNECANNNGGCDDACTNTIGSFSCRCTHIGKVLSADNLACEDCSPRQFFNTSSHSCVDCPAHATARDGLALSVKDCSCDPGFHGSPKLQVECQDTNECQTGKMICSHECVNTIGSAHCACPLGLALAEDNRTCKDIDECEGTNHTCDQICANTEGSYVCSCNVGFRQINHSGVCEDINECDMGVKNICEQGCNNTAGSYTCTCRKGFKISDNLMTCEDINECMQAVSPCGHKCVNTEGSFKCECEGAGFKLSRDMSSCIDINECMEGDNPCPDICVNTIGSYECDCNRPGYLLSADGSGCADIDECGQNPNPCPHKCINTPGSYACRCPLGHADPPKHDKSLCRECGYGTYRGKDDNECEPCPAESNTTKTGSTSREDCVCSKGYLRDPSSLDTCIDVDECRTGDLKCEHGCVNIPGSAHCTCRPGFMLSRADNVSCVDSDECGMHNGGCEHICVNTPGSFHCKCRGENFKLAANGLSCEDENACASRKHGCEYKCVNSPTGASCTCPTGYKLMRDGKKCRDVDECRKQNGGCTDTCINSPGSYKCECNIPGYRLYRDGRQCTDIDECDPRGRMSLGLESKPCEDICANTIGSFTCQCRRPGYTLARDMRSCADIDECERGNMCQHRCINLPGSFRCDCHAGYYRQGTRCAPCPKGSYRGLRDSAINCELCPPGMTTAGKATESIHECKCPRGFDGNPETGDKCQDVNECASNNGGCAHECQNTRGSFACNCQEGYLLGVDGKSCNPTKCALLEPPKYAKFKSAVCAQMAKAGQHVEPGTVCEYKCRGMLILEGSQNRTCLSNFTWTGSQPKCDAFPCERLKIPRHGYLHPPLCMLPRVPFRTRCLIKCKPGYIRKGQRAAKCKANMRWSGKIRRVPTTCEPGWSSISKGKSSAGKPWQSRPNSSNGSSSWQDRKKNNKNSTESSGSNKKLTWRQRKALNRAKTNRSNGTSGKSSPNTRIHVENEEDDKNGNKTINRSDNGSKDEKLDKAGLKGVKIGRGSDDTVGNKTVGKSVDRPRGKTDERSGDTKLIGATSKTSEEGKIRSNKSKRGKESNGKKSIWSRGRKKGNGKFRSWKSRRLDKERRTSKKDAKSS